ncbi:MAG: copper chaperone PCu(A)C [Pseudomonadota bacterium]|nr:MAG: copper chaperone PCu(A)C [Pseudomonadota bacterium]
MSYLINERGLAAALLIAVASIANAGAPLEVSDARVPEAPPVSTVLAGYMKIINRSSDAVKIVEVRSSQFKHVEIHLSETRDGIARMVKQDALKIAAGKTVDLAPGGLHLMLIEPQQALREGDVVVLTLVLDGGREVTVNAPVRREAAGHEHHHHNH